MIFTDLPLPGAVLIDLEKIEDHRGFFARSFCAETFAARGLASRFVQMNTSFTAARGALRGMHFQRPPAAETKMVRCLRGAVFDVIVDLRAGSRTYGAWTGVELSAENRTMIHIPRGFAHGFQTLTEDAELLYWHDTAYAPGHEGGLHHACPDVGIAWPLPIAEMSARDAALPRLHELEPLTP
jgi:dTDP-4-dehydrorhamnose 3,5-epimerase